jgi:outer membrane lipoprotein SlyB
LRLVAVFDSAFALPDFGAEKHEVYSNRPLHLPETPNHALAGAIAGGLLGGLGGGSLAAFTFEKMHLQTGHMAILSLPPAGIATFAAGALGAIAGALIAFLLQAELHITHLEMPAEVRAEIANGAVAVMFEEATPETEQAMHAAGGRTLWC